MKRYLYAHYEQFLAGVWMFLGISSMIAFGGFVALIEGAPITVALILCVPPLLFLSMWGYLIWFKWDFEHYKRCPSCRSVVLIEQRYCPKCGFDINPICPSCNEVAGPRDEFCPSCGAGLKRSSPQNFLRDTPIPSGANHLDQTYYSTVSATSSLFCPECDTRIEPGSSFCGACGGALEPTVIRPHE